MSVSLVFTVTTDSEFKEVLRQLPVRGFGDDEMAIRIVSAKLNFEPKFHGMQYRFSELVTARHSVNLG